MTTIITKYGYGKPSDSALAKGEVAVDLNEGILYSSTNGADIIELGRGELDWDNIVGKPEWITEGEDFIDITELKSRVETNEGDITTNKNSISKLDSQINDENGLADQVEENTSNIGGNAQKIKDIEDLLDASLTGLVYGGTYDAQNNVVVEASDDGKNAGLEDGKALPSGESTKGIYVVVTVEGELAGTGGFNAEGKAGRADGDTAHVGDWLVSDGQHGWILMSFGMDAVNWGMIGGSLSNQTDLVSEFALYLKKTDTIDGGTYS